MILEEAIQTGIREALRKAGLETDEIPLEEPKSKSHGDVSTNVAFLCAKKAGKAPRDLAVLLTENMKPYPAWLERVEVAGSGFINLTLTAEAYFRSLEEIEAKGSAFGRSGLGKGKKVLLEFVSANPTGPLNVVSARAAAVGDALASILGFAGYAASREFYVNDVGGQIDLFGKSIAARVAELRGGSAKQSADLAVPFPEEGYRGEYVRELARDWNAAHPKETPDPSALAEWGVARMVESQKKNLENFGVVYNDWVLQSRFFQNGAVEKTLSLLEEKGFLYEEEGALFFRTTAFGDDKDRVVRKKDGSLTYFASDIAYHADKFARGHERLIDLFGPDHHGYIARTRAACEALGYAPRRLEILIVQQVNLLRGEERVKMSKRAGELVPMDELAAEVGRDAARYFFLQRAVSTHLDFDLELAKKQTPENPVFYIQYAHARIASIFRKAKEEGIPAEFSGWDWRRLDLPQEKELVKQLFSFPDAVRRAALELAPHTVAFYLLDLARAFQHYYSQAKQDPRYRVLNPAEPEAMRAKLYLLKNIRIVLQNGLKLLGISAPERMD